MGVETLPQGRRHDHLRQVDGRSRIRGRVLRLRSRKDRAQTRHDGGSPGTKNRTRRLNGRRQNHHHKSHQPLLRHRRRKDQIRQYQYHQDQKGRFASFYGYGFARYAPLYGDGCRQYQVRQTRRNRRGSQKRRKTRKCGLFHPPLARRLRYDAHRRRRKPLARSTPTYRNRACRSCQSARPHSRRSDEFDRHPH